MIVFDLQCRDGGETFEAWFQSNSDFEAQRTGGLVQCPCCGSTQVDKAPMAPRVPHSRTSDALSKLAAAQARMLKDSRWVGDEFTETARAMHSGERKPELVHGSASIDQAKSLAAEGVPIAPLPLPVVPPSQVN